MQIKRIATASLISLFSFSAIGAAQAEEFGHIMTCVDPRSATPEMLSLPESASTHAGFGDDSVNFGYPKAAVREYTQAIIVNPSFARINSKPGNYFLAYGRNGDNSRVMQNLLSQYNEILKKTPTDPYALAVRGEIKFVLNDIDGAEADFKKSLAYKSDLLFSHIRLAEVGMFERATERTIAYCQQALNHFPQNARIHCNLGLAYEERGLHDRAIAEYDKSIDLDPRFSRAYMNRAVAYSKTNNFKAEFNDLTLCRELEPDFKIATMFWLHEQKRQRQYLAGTSEMRHCRHLTASCPHNQPLPQQKKTWLLTVLLSLTTLLAALIPRQLRQHLLFHE